MRFNHILLAILFFLGVPFLANAQYEGLSALSEGKFEQAKSIFEDQIQEKKNQIIGYFGLAQLYADSTYQANDLFKASTYIKEFSTDIKAVGDKRKQELKENGISTRILKPIKAAVTQRAIANARSRKTPEYYQRVLTEVKLSYDEKILLRQEYVETVIQKVLKEKTLELSQKTADQYRPLVKKYDREALVRLDGAIVNSFANHLGITLESDDEIIVEQQKAQALIYRNGAWGTGDIAAYQSFVDTYPNSIFIANAKDSLQLLNAFETLNSSATISFAGLQKIIKPFVEEKTWGKTAMLIRAVEPKYVGDTTFYTQLLAIIEADVEQVERKALPVGINRFDAYVPVVTVDEEVLYFCGRNPSEDIMKSEKIDGVWQQATPIQELCTRGHESPLSISADGVTMIIFNNGKLKRTERTADGWSTPEPFPAHINNYDWVSDARIAADGKSMLFVIRKSGHQDIYVTERNEIGEWSDPINLGSTINNSRNQRSPFLSPDMKTLYFSSNGHGGLGNLDVFVSKRLDNSWTNWSTPINLGKEVNTTLADWGYCISISGERAYFSAQSSRSSGEDIYEMNLPQATRPEAVQTIEGTVKGLADEESATIIVYDDRTGERVAELKTEPTTGEYFVALPLGVEPRVRVIKEGVYSKETTIEMSESKGEDGTTKTKADITVIDLGSENLEDMEITFDEAVLFGYNEFDLDTAAQDELNTLLIALKDRSLQITIEGHTDSIGNEAYNRTLSLNRANVVKDYFVAKGYPADLIIAKGLGQTKPIASNETEDGRHLNRRVTFSFVKK